MTRHIERSGRSRTAARLALQEELRTQRGERTEMLRPESRFRDAAAIYTAKIVARREDSTADAYAYWLEKMLLPPARRAPTRRVRRRPDGRVLHPPGARSA